MNSRPTILFAAPGLAIALFALVSPSVAEETLTTPVSSGGNGDADETTDDSKEESSRKHRATRVTRRGVRLTDSDFSLALALETAAAEVEPVIVRGFDVSPPDYPALPEVEGTKINSGKKTSFAKPGDFPTNARQ